MSSEIRQTADNYYSKSSPENEEINQLKIDLSSLQDTHSILCAYHAQAPAVSQPANRRVMLKKMSKHKRLRDRIRAKSKQNSA